MFIQNHRTRDTAAPVPPRPAFSDSLLSVVPMSGSMSDLAGTAMIAWLPLEALVDPDDARNQADFP